jgi:hypothetical protein
VPFQTPIDVANRACQHVNQLKIVTFADDSRQAVEINTAYDVLRLAELSRHTWAFSIRRARCRAITFSTQLWTPPTYNSATAYTVGQVVMFAGGTYANSANYPWILQVPTATGLQPDISPQWSHYFGPLTADIFDPGTTYAAGEVTILPPAYSSGTTYAEGNIVLDSSGNMWVSLVGSNTGHTPSSSPTFWTPWLFPSGGITPPYTAITFNGTPSVYLSIANNNGPASGTTLAALPNASTKWTEVGGTLQQITILWPLGSGPTGQAGTPDLFRLPFGWLRPVPKKAFGTKYAWLGALRGPDPEDLEYEGQYFTSDDLSPNNGVPFVDVTFVADIADVTVMAPQFCESLAVRIGLEIDGTLTEGKNEQKLDRAYKRITGEAIRIDAILQGFPTQELEEFIVVRF